jgi:hypothetical protein
VRQLAIFACYVLATACLGVLVAIGYLLSKLYREVPPGDEAWNCWSFAVPSFLQSPVTSALMISCSQHAKFIPHVRYVGDVSKVSYEEAVPARPRKGWRAAFDSVKFKAKIRKNNGNDQ